MRMMIRVRDDIAWCHQPGHRPSNYSTSRDRVYSCSTKQKAKKITFTNSMLLQSADGIKINFAFRGMRKFKICFLIQFLLQMLVMDRYNLKKKNHGNGCV